jgi:peptidoglycan-associated lipoprotein
MKTKKLTYLLVLGLSFTFTVVGCKKKTTSVTPLDPARAGEATPDLGTNPALNPDANAQATGGLPSWRPEDFNPDPTAFAAEVVHFDYDSAVVRESEMAHVEAVAAKLRSEGSAMLLIEGHCDERGTEEYNRSLGERRALTLRDELAKRDIDGMRVQPRSFGEDRPVAVGQDESAWSKNRRGEFVLLRPKQ